MMPCVLLRLLQYFIVMCELAKFPTPLYNNSRKNLPLQETDETYPNSGCSNFFEPRVDQIDWQLQGEIVCPHALVDIPR